MTKLKNSDVYWMGEVAEDFDIVPSTIVFRERSEKNLADDVHLTPSQKYGVLPQDQYQEITGGKVMQKLSDSDMKHVEPDDFVIHLRSFQGGIERSQIRGKVSTAYTVLEPRDGVFTGYWRYFLKSAPFIEGMASSTDQLRDGQTINYSRFSRLKLLRPPLETQRRIADYLDKEISEMDALIEEFEELVKNLELKRSLEINQVFKKLEPRLPIGYVVNTKTNGTMINGETIPAEGEEFGVLKTSAVSTGAFKPTQNKKILPEEQHLATVPVTGGTLLINRLNSPDYVGSCAYVESDFPTLFVSDKIWKLDLTINNRFFHYWTFTHDYRHQVREAIVGTSSSMQSLSYNAFLRYKMPVPDEETQNSVVSDLDRTFERMDALIEESTRLIENLKARKTALITEVVTGRKEV